jgi:hypothetical protein
VVDSRLILFMEQNVPKLEHQALKSQEKWVRLSSIVVVGRVDSASSDDGDIPCNSVFVLNQSYLTSG